MTSVFVACQFSSDPFGVKAQVSHVLQQTGVIKRMLVCEKYVVHFPELALRCRGLGDLRGVLPMRMDLCHREMAERHAQLVSERFPQSGDDWLGGAAIWAFEIAVLDQRNRRGPAPPDVIACAERLAESVV